VVFVSRELDTTRDVEVIETPEGEDPAQGIPGDPRDPDAAGNVVDVDGDGVLDPDERPGNIPPPPRVVPRESAIERAEHGTLVHLDEGGRTRVLVDSRAADAPGWTPVDVMDPDVSYDGARVVFSGYSEEEGGWRIYEVGISGTGLRQLTRDDREVDLERYGEAAAALEGFDDLDPSYLPDGRIVLVSTRAPGVAPDNRLRSTNLYVMNADGSGLHKITTERFGADTPAVDPSSGQIVYSRWWRTVQPVIGDAPSEPIPPGSPGYDDVPGSTNPLGVTSPSVLRGVAEEEFPGVNSWFLASINPDGTDMAMFSGVRLDRELTQAYRPSFLASGEALALFIPKTPFIGFPRGNGLRVYSAGPRAPEAVGGPQTFSGGAVPLPPGVADNGLPGDLPIDVNRESFRFAFASAAELPDGRILVSAAPLHDTRYDLYALERGTGRMDRLFGAPDRAELDAVPAVPRAPAPIIADRAAGTLPEDAPRTVEEAFAAGGSFTFRVENVHFNAPLDTPIVNAPPVGKRLAIEFYMQPQRTSAEAADPPILIRREEIPPDGRVEVELPAGVPLFELLRQPDGTLAQGRDNQIFHVAGMNFSRAAETGRCVGCHAGHTMMEIPEDPSWTNLAPSAVVSADPAPAFPRDPNAAGDAAVEPGAEGLLVGQLFFPPQNLVDRRTDHFAEWVGSLLEGVERNAVTLRWSVPIRARRAVVHGPASPDTIFGPRVQEIRGFTLTTFLDGLTVEQIEVRETLGTQGESAAVALDPERPFDRLEVSIRSEDVHAVGGFDPALPEAVLAPALAEIEVEAQVGGSGSVAMASFLRGDANCDLRQDIVDPVVTLNSLFLGGGRLCCEAAADADADGRINITDPVIVLNFLFLSGAPPARPGTECGRVELGSLLCDFESCP
jgi:hypothetical protein